MPGGPVGEFPCHQVHQVHGSVVHVVTGDIAEPVPTGDALVSAHPTARLLVLTADCASIAMGSPEGVFAAVHAGWRGLAAGVIESAAAAMGDAGASVVTGSLGPCIHAECYAFSPPDLSALVDHYGDRVLGVTSAGGLALDLPAAVGAAFARAGVTEVPGVDRCTACDERYFSHRARGDRGRQALIVWRDSP
ncbi:MAG TPA: polyphenol oxidase family protein [Acidimicrobiales bacterium]|nr:polyphenol oxidase family protein [Acidimicrobiales bacterium]